MASRSNAYSGQQGIRCIIVEDEAIARNSLKRLCEQHGSLDLLAMFDNGAVALDFLSEYEVDLIWLDVEMPGLSGFDLLERLPSIPYVVFTTSQTEYAFDAFQYQITDYLKKPITLPRFNLAVEKVLDLMNRRTNAYALSEPQEIYIKSDGRYIKLNYDTILFVKSTGDYVKVVTTTKTYVVYATMTYIEAKLGSQFMRVHRYYIVHLDKIEDIEENTLVIGKEVIPISRANKAELMNRLNLL